MRWFAALVLFDIAVIAALVTTVGQTQRADLVFASSSEHNFLDPQRLSWSHDIRVAECLFEPLVRMELPAMTVGPATAERWQISDDGLAYTFFLREDAKWSNGDPVKASDFIYAWRRALMPDLAADYTQLFWCIEGAEDFFYWRQQQIEAYAVDKAGQNPDEARRLLDEALERFKETVGVSTPDDHTLVIKLDRPTPYFLELCAFITFSPVHEKTVSNQVSMDPETGTLIQDPYWTRPDRLVCNGPYVLQRRRFQRDLQLVLNEHYWNRAAMGNRSIMELIVRDPQTQLLMYERGEVDWLPSIPSTGSLAADLVDEQRDDAHLTPAAGTYFYNFNCQQTLADGSPNPLADARVRRALSMTIDRNAIVEQVTRLNQPVARTFVPLGALPAYDPPVESGIDFDPEAARSLLAEAGYPGGKRLTGLSILYNTGSGHEMIAQQIARTWQQELGVVVTLEGLEVSVFGDRLKNHDFTIARAGWFGDYLDPTTFLDKFKTGNGNNDGAYSNRRFDKLLRQAAEELDPAKRMKILREAEALMLGEQPIAPIYQYVTLHLFRPDRVKDMHLNPWNFRRLEFVRVERHR